MNNIIDIFISRAPVIKRNKQIKIYKWLMKRSREMDAWYAFDNGSSEHRTNFVNNFFPLYEYKKDTKIE